MALSPARRLPALSSTLLCQGGDDDEISKISFAPSLRIDAQLEMLTQEVLRYLLLVYLGALYLYQAQQDPRTMVLDNRTRSVGLKDLIL